MHKKFHRLDVSRQESGKLPGCFECTCDISPRRPCKPRSCIPSDGKESFLAIFLLPGCFMFLF